MNTEFLRMAVLVRETGSFAAAARALNVDPSTVSKSIQALESSLEFRLFQRSTRMLKPTEAGDNYLDSARSIIEELENAKETALVQIGQPTGCLRIAASVSFGKICLVNLLPIFRERYPDLKLALVLEDSPADLIASGIDLAIRHGRQPKGDFTIAKLCDTRYRVCASPDYLSSTYHAIIHPKDLENHRCLIFDLPGFRSHWSFSGKDQSFEVAITSDISVSTAIALRGAARIGCGPALLPDWLVLDDLKTGRLVDCLPGFEVSASDFESAIWFVYPSRSFLPLKVRVAIDLIRSSIGKS